MSSITLVFSKPTHMRYLAVATVGTEVIEVLGATLLADAVGGPLKTIFSVKTQGYGKIAAGATITNAIARALLAGDNSVATVGANIPIAFISAQQVSGAGKIGVDALQDIGDPLSPMLEINMPNVATAYIDVYIPGAIGYRR